MSPLHDLQLPAKSTTRKIFKVVCN